MPRSLPSPGRLRRRHLLVPVAAMLLALALPGSGLAGAPAAPRPDPAGILDLPRGFSYNVLAAGGETSVVSTESGATFPMPEDPDANVLTPAIGGGWWLTTAHELTEPRPGDFQGDAGKAAVDEQAMADDGDSDGWGSVTRLRLGPNGRRVLESEVITTGLHNLCAGDLTPWGRCWSTRSSRSSTTPSAVPAGAGRSTRSPATPPGSPGWAASATSSRPSAPTAPGT